MSGVVLRFDRLDSGELVAMHTHEGRSVAAIVLPAPVGTRGAELGVHRWTIAGDLTHRRARPRGASERVAVACAEAAAALGAELGIPVLGYEVAR